MFDVRLFRQRAFVGISVATFCIAAGMFAFMTAWNDYLYAVILTSTTAAKTLPVVVAGFATDVTTERTLMATSGVLAIIPPLALAFLFQRLIIQGLTSGAVKD